MKEIDELVLIYKKRGETPLQSLDRLRLEKPEYKNERLSYAGRLDPMAEGLVLVLSGKYNNDRDKYLGFTKEYETDILFGIDTDTGDVLGKVLDIDLKEISRDVLLKNLGLFGGEINQKYPDFSSKTINGKALFEHTKQGQSFENQYHKVSVYDIFLIDFKSINSNDLLNKIEQDISIVKGDFRQEEILKIYKEKFKNINCDFKMATFNLKVSSGFYIRQFAKDFAEKLSSRAIAFRIFRKKVGDFDVVDCSL